MLECKYKYVDYSVRRVIVLALQPHPHCRGKVARRLMGEFMHLKLRGDG
jgi:hypothetical protein